MMSDAIIVALISACATVLAQLAINAQNKKEMSITQAVRDKDHRFIPTGAEHIFIHFAFCNRV